MTRKKVRAGQPLCGGHTGAPGAVPPGVVATAPALPQPPGANLRHALRAWLDWHGLTQGDAAHVLKVSHSTISLLVTRKNTGRRDGLLGRLLDLLVGPGAAQCRECHRVLPDEQLAARLMGLLDEARQASP